MARFKINRKDKLEERQKGAVVRLEERTKRTPQQQIAVLDAKLGVGVGAVRERERLNKLLG